MTHVTIPYPKKNCALILVDVQKGFIRKPDAKILANICALLTQHDYEACVEATFGTQKNTLWKTQVHWSFPLEPTISAVRSLIPRKRTLHVQKDTKSVFKGNKDVHAFLKRHRIEVIHIVGFDTNDCVFATAQESFDLGFMTYVIEECTGSSQSESLRRKAIDILRELEMTNRSSFIKSRKSIRP